MSRHCTMTYSVSSTEKISIQRVKKILLFPIFRKIEEFSKTLLFLSKISLVLINTRRKGFDDFIPSL